LFSIAKLQPFPHPPTTRITGLSTPITGKDHAASHPSALWLEGDKDGSTVAFSQNSRERKLTLWGVAGYVVVYFLPKRQ
jgi:hypothetical protein